VVPSESSDILHLKTVYYYEITIQAKRFD